MADTRKSAWRIYLAMPLLAASYFLLFSAIIYIPIPAVQVFIYFAALLIGMIALSLAQDDGRERGEPHV